MMKRTKLTLVLAGMVAFATAQFIAPGDGRARGETIPIRLMNGQTAYVPDFIHDPRTIDETHITGVNQYLLAGTTGLCSNPKVRCATGPKNAPFNIIYAAADHAFTITLTQRPIGPARAQAEQYLMRRLGLPGSNMCLLKYFLTTTTYVDATYGGNNLLFSFCPGAVRLSGDQGIRTGQTPTQPDISAEGVIAYSRGSRAYFYHGNTFTLGPLTLGILKAYCTNLQVNGRSWHLASADELQPALTFLAHGQGVWSDFSEIQPHGPGYMLVTATPEAAPGFVDVYELYGNTVNQQASFLGIRGQFVGGPTVDSIPLTDGSGNHEFVKVVCISDANSPPVRH